ncbi:MAG: hypothetical protein Q8O88_03810 [bacterium]|nr:hypothetical protein [bacterium]
MAKKKKITNAQHFKNATKLYEAKGQSAVFDYANKHKIGYEICGKQACDTESPAINHTCLVCGQETKEKKKKYVVAVCRTAYAFRDIEVEAQNETEAMKLALEDAGNHEFSEKNADYTTEGLREI